MGSLEEAQALKAKGNKAFASHDWPTAVDFYTQAIDMYDQEPSFFSNRAQVCKDWVVIIGDCLTYRRTGKYQIGGVWFRNCRRYQSD
jgi:hypothetical protein